MRILWVFLHYVQIDWNNLLHIKPNEKVKIKG